MSINMTVGTYLSQILVLPHLMVELAHDMDLTIVIILIVMRISSLFTNKNFYWLCGNFDPDRASFVALLPYEIFHLWYVCCS
jgi:hypothetical protein